jgi:hypothetical protein
MNMQAMMREAQKLQRELLKTQEELGATIYDGHSSLVNVKINGNKELVSIDIDKDNSLEKDDIDMLEDMIIIAINDAVKKADADKQQRLGKYGSGLSGLM